MKNNKSLGQHWLKNRNLLNQIAKLSYTPDAEFCLEIGPGLGTLTSSLLKLFPEVIAIEYDARLAGNLPASFPGKPLTVIHADILQTNLTTIANSRKYAIAGNIPYYITSPIIKQVLTSPAPPEKVALLIQKEVAERIAASDGHQTMLSLFVQNLATVELGPVVSAAEFTPPPKVDSQVLILTPLVRPLVNPACLELAKIGFSSPRKKLVQNLATGTNRSKADWRALLDQYTIDPDCRPGDLDLGDWENLYHAINPGS